MNEWTDLHVLTASRRDRRNSSDQRDVRCNCELLWRYGLAKEWCLHGRDVNRTAVFYETPFVPKAIQSIVVHCSLFCLLICFVPVDHSFLLESFQVSASYLIGRTQCGIGMALYLIPLYWPTFLVISYTRTMKYSRFSRTVPCALCIHLFHGWNRPSSSPALYGLFLCSVPKPRPRSQEASGWPSQGRVPLGRWSVDKWSDLENRHEDDDDDGDSATRRW